MPEHSAGTNPIHRLLFPLFSLLCATIWLSACTRPDGRAEFKASHDAFRRLDRITVEWTTKTRRGAWVETAEIDCPATYYHYRSVRDLTPKGIEEDTTTGQGRPLAHKEEERLFLNGRSMTKATSEWEDPRQADGHDWTPASANFDPTEDCRGLHTSPNNAFIAFTKIVEANRIEYRGKVTIGGVACHQYRVTYPDLVYTDKTRTIQLGPGSTYSEAVQAVKPVQATIAIAITDRLPRQAIKDDRTVMFSYTPITPVTLAALQR